MFAYPCTRDARVTQMFGQRPAAYAQFGLPGHNGVDFGLPVGSAVYATDAGTVIEVGDEPRGYGRYVKLDHPWGESIYAHLSQIVVGHGHVVGAGQRVGLSGNTGNSTGPHLHFGVRVKPYNRAVWGGWSDPWPFLDRILRPDYRTGPYLAGPQVSSMLGVLARWQPAFAVYMNPSPSTAAEIKRLSPGTKLIGRVYVDDNEVASRIRANPVDAGRWMDGRIRSHPAFGICDYWYVVNEVLQQDWAEWQQLTQAMNAWLDAAGNAYKCALYQFSVGNPDLPRHDPLAFWRVTVPVLERAVSGGHLLAIHQYGAPNLDDPARDWYGWRFEMQNILLRLDAERPASARVSVPSLTALNVVCSEWGVDWLIYNQKAGWQKELSAQQYAQQLIAGERFSRRYPFVKGKAVFTAGAENYADWGSYDIWQAVAERLAADAEAERSGNPQPAPPVPPPVPNTLHDALLAEAERRQVIQFNRDAALQKVIFADGFVPNSPEFELEHGGTSYVAQRAERLDTHSARVYYCPRGQWDAVLFVERGV